MSITVRKTEVRIVLIFIGLVVAANFIFSEKARHERFFKKNRETLECVASTVRDAAGDSEWTDVPFGSVLIRYQPYDELFDACDMSVLKELGADKVLILLLEDGGVAVSRYAAPMSFRTYFSYLKTTNSAIVVNRRFGGSLVESYLGDDWYYINDD